MPPQAKFSRKEIVSTALEITRENGLGAVTARELGTRLKSSARLYLLYLKIWRRSIKRW